MTVDARRDGGVCSRRLSSQAGHAPHDASGELNDLPKGNRSGWTDRQALPERQEADLSPRSAASDGRTEVIIDQYWSDLRKEVPRLVVQFDHVPPMFETSVSRRFASKEGGSVSLYGASMGLIPGETRRLDLGPLSEQQRDRHDWIRE